MQSEPDVLEITMGIGVRFGKVSARGREKEVFAIDADVFPLSRKFYSFSALEQRWGP